jgi:hypothetical protein
MHRTQILLDEWQYEVLKTRAEQEGTSLSHMVREAVEAYLTKDQRKAQKMLDQIEGIGKDSKAKGRDHDKHLYRVKSRRSR